MSALRRAALLACLLPSVMLRAQATASPDPTGVFQRLISERYAAVTRADTAAYRRLADPWLVFLEDDGSRKSIGDRVREIAAKGPENDRLRRDVDSLHVDIAGNVALVDYWIVEHEPLGPREQLSPYRALDVYALRGGQWRLLRHAETHGLALPAPVTLSASALDEFVGRYEWWPGYIDTITRQGDQLFDQTTGEKKATLNLAATPESFYIAGEAALLVFVRDKTGRVVGYVLHWPDGQVTSARKLR
jgi:hypothetical protein